MGGSWGEQPASSAQLVTPPVWRRQPPGSPRHAPQRSFNASFLLICDLRELHVLR
ncbi:unnamed protein product [Ectocarpus sp. CCAP 1310/34]|nr:unnamed protein product [Ectocarpus sp. CCAP 1310/34]